jgi:hypothetical protein
MKTIVLRFGLLSGAVLAALGAVTLPLCMSGGIDFANQEIVGYSAMVLAYAFVFFGIRSYREGLGGGAITFGKAFQVGILITLVTCAVYIVTWEIVYHGFVPDFIDTYSAHVVDKLRADGATAEALAAKRSEMARFKELYANPLFNVAITFLEVFPVGLIVTLVSAAILRRKSGPGELAHGPAGA